MLKMSHRTSRGHSFSSSLTTDRLAPRIAKIMTAAEQVGRSIWLNEFKVGLTPYSAKAK